MTDLDEQATEAAVLGAVKAEINRRAPRGVVFSETQAEWLALGAVAAYLAARGPEQARERRIEHETVDGPYEVTDASTGEALPYAEQVPTPEQPDGQSTALVAVKAEEDLGLVRVQLSLDAPSYLLPASQARNLSELLIEAVERIKHDD
jgi:hypothetical protein